MPTKKDLAITTPDDENEEDATDRETWDNQCEFFLSCLGFAVGFGNVWRFPFLCYKNGGAAFLIPYCIMLFLAGLPMFFLELALGQYVSLGPSVLFPELAPIFSGLGWAMILTTGMTSLYYNMVFAWSLFYTFASLTTELPWGNCDNDFNSIGCFTYQDSSACHNNSMIFYNRSCMALEDFCSLSGREQFNATHCKELSDTDAILAEKTVARISSSEDYYKNRMLGVTGRTWEDMGNLRWEIVGCFGLAWIIVCACMIKGVKSSGKVVYVTAIFPYIVLAILLIRGLTLEGAYKGIEFYLLKPNLTKLAETQVWNDAATQIFYSLGSSFGGLITLASYNKFHNNCMRDAVIIALSNCVTSVFAGFVIFSILGFMAHEINVPVKDVVDSGSGLAFIAYPAAVARMPYPPIWSFLFFMMLITLGIDSQFTYVETLATGIFDKFESLRPKKSLVMIGLSTIMFLLGLPLCLDGGVFLFELLNYYSGSLSVLFIAICEVFSVSYLYGFKRFMKNLSEEMGIRMPNFVYRYWGITWLFCTPVSLCTIFVFSLYFFQPARWGSYIYPDNIQALGWLTTFASMAFIPLGIIYIIFCVKVKGKELITATDQFCPAHRRKLNKSMQAEGYTKRGAENASFEFDLHL